MSRSMIRAVLILSLILLGWQSADAAIQVVGTTTGRAGANTTSDTLQIVRTVTAGNLLITCSAVFNPNGSTLTVSDNLNGAHTQAVTRVDTTGGTDQLYCHYKANVLGGSTTVTINPAGAGADIGGFVMEVSGATTTPLDVTVAGGAAIGAAASFTPSITTATLAQANNLVVGIMMPRVQEGAVLTPGTGFTQIDENESQSNATAFNAQYKIVNATTAVVVPWAQINNTGAASEWGAIAAVFKELVSTDVTPPTNPSAMVVTNITSVRNDVSFTGSTDSGGSGLAGYEIFRCQGSGCTPSAGILVSSQVGLSFIDLGLTPGTIYGYAARAFDGAGLRSGFAATAYATTLASQSKIISWTPNAPLTQDGFSLRHCITTSASCTPDTFLTTVGPGVTSFTHSTSGRPVSCYDVQATLTGTAGSAISTPGCSTAVASQFTLTMVVAGTGSGTVIPAAGPSIYPSGTVVNLTAVRGANSDFAGWSGTGCPATSNLNETVTMSGDKTCTATFNLQTGAFGYVAHRGSGTSKTLGTTLTFNPTATIVVDRLAIARCSSDNAATVNGQTSEHVLTDSVGNVWQKLREHTNAGGAADSGVTTSLWAARVQNQLVTGSVLTLTLSTPRIAKVCGLEEFLLNASTIVTIAGGVGTVGTTPTNPPSGVLSGLASNTYLWLGSVGSEGPNTTTYTNPTNYAAGVATIGTTGGATTSNVSNSFGFRRLLATTDTFAPALGTGVDWSTVFVAIATAAAPTQHTVTLATTGAGTGVVTGGGTFNDGTAVRIQATANPGSGFVSWATTSGDSCVAAGATDPIQFVTLTQNTTCTASFNTTPVPPTTFNLVITNAGSGTGTTTPSGTTSQNSGTVVNLVATAGAGSFFAGWSGDADCTDGSVTMTAARACTATFTLLPTFALTLTTAGTGVGSVSGAGTFPQNTLTPIVATPSQGSVFAGWSGSTGCASANASSTVLMDGTKACVATFNVATGTLPTGILVNVPKRRCTINIEARIVSTPGIVSVNWTIDDQSVAIQTTPTSTGAGIYTYFFRKTLVYEGSEVFAQATDAAGQTGAIGPFATVCP